MIIYISILFDLVEFLIIYVPSNFAVNGGSDCLPSPTGRPPGPAFARSRLQHLDHAGEGLA